MFVKNMLLAVALIAFFAGEAFAQDKPPSRLEREVEYLMSIWPGEFDNYAQLKFDRNVGLPTGEDGGRIRVHRHIIKADLPAFGPNVLYMEEFKHNDPEQIMRQRLYVLSADEDEQAVRIQLYFLKGGKAYSGAYKDKSLLANVGLEDTFLAKKCDMLLKRDGELFTGGVPLRKCVLTHDGPARYSDFQIKIAPWAQWFRYQTVNMETGEQVSTLSNYKWHKLRRARHFVCMVDVPKSAGASTYKTLAYAEMHDQGGDYAFMHPDGRKIEMTLSNSWNYSMQRETLVLVANNPNPDEPALGYAWADKKAKNIGFAIPGELRLQCDLGTPENRKLQQNIRPAS